MSGPKKIRRHGKTPIAAIEAWRKRIGEPGRCPRCGARQDGPAANGRGGLQMECYQCGKVVPDNPDAKVG